MIRRVPILAAAALTLGGAGLTPPAAGQQLREDIAERPLPRPTGPHAIGTRDFAWVDEDRPEIFTKDPADRRHIRVQVWYPADPGSGGELARYIVDPEEFTTPALFEPLLHVRTNARLDAPVADSPRRLPVLVFSHGGGWTRFSSSFATEEMASHGYVVVAIDHTGFNQSSVFPDGYRFAMDTLGIPQLTEGPLYERAMRTFDHLGGVVFPEWVADARFVLDRLEAMDAGGSFLAGRLDLDRVGMFGWSFGGATSVQMSRIDPRVKAAVDQDGQLFGDVATQGSDRPVMLFHSDPPPAGDDDMRRLLDLVENTTATFLARTRGPWYDVEVEGSSHGSYSDLVLFIDGDAKLEPARGHAIINAYTLAFFDRYLKGEPAPLLDGEPPFAEVRLRRGGAEAGGPQP